jgi:hypothetical protein
MINFQRAHTTNSVEDSVRSTVAIPVIVVFLGCRGYSQTADTNQTSEVVSSDGNSAAAQPSVSYHGDGSLKSRVSRIEGGTLHGSYETYSVGGKPSVKGQYTNGVMTGKWQYYDEKGKLSRIMVYGDDGSLSSDVPIGAPKPTTAPSNGQQMHSGQIKVANSADRANRFEVAIGLGYGTGLGRTYRESVVDAVDDSTGFGYEYLEYNDKHYSFGNGAKGTIGFTGYATEGLGIAFESALTVLGGFTNTSQYNGYDLVEAVDANSIAFCLGLKLRSHSRRLQPYLAVMPGIILPFGVEYAEEDFEVGFRSNYTEEMYFAPGFSVRSHVGLAVGLGKHCALDFGLRPAYAFARLKELQWRSVNLQTGTASHGTVYFEDDEADLAESTAYVDYVHGRPTYSFSSLDFALGIVIQF